MMSDALYKLAYDKGAGVAQRAVSRVVKGKPFAPPGVMNNPERLQLHMQQMSSPKQSFLGGAKEISATRLTPPSVLKQRLETSNTRRPPLWNLIQDLL